MTIKHSLTALVFAAGLVLAPFEAGGFGGGGGAKTTPAPGAAAFAAGKKAVDNGDHQAAIQFLSKAAAADPNKADVFNLLGYSYRKLGDVEMAFKQYGRALELEPKHRGANEYIGELYLETGNLAKAEEHLEVLDKACFFGCEEYRELKQAVNAYKAGKEG